jgi:replicative DNA helicase
MNNKDNIVGFNRKENQPASDGTLPANVEAERAVLGSMIIDPDAYILVDYLAVDDFYRNCHRQLYEVIRYLTEIGEAADFITIEAELERRNIRLDVNIENASFLAGIYENVPSSANIEYHAHVIESLGVRRRLLAAASEIATSAMNDTADEALVLAESTVLGINNNHNVTTYEPISNIMSRCIERMNTPAPNGMIGIPTGFQDLDNMLRGLRKKALYILAARPAMGKTSLALKIAMNAAKKGQKVAFFSLEMGSEELGFRLISIETRLDSTRIQTGQIDDHEWELIERKMSEISETSLLLDETGGLSIDQLFSRCRQIQAKGGLDLILVDYLQLLHGTKDGKPMENRVNEISSISQKLKVIAKTLDVPVVALAQLSRSLESRQSKVPTLPDLRESGSIEQDADVVMFIYRDEYYNPESERKGLADIIIAKNRSGPVGEITLFFTPNSTNFANLEVSPQEE